MSKSRIAVASTFFVAFVVFLWQLLYGLYQAALTTDMRLLEMMLAPRCSTSLRLCAIDMFAPIVQAYTFVSNPSIQMNIAAASAVTFLLVGAVGARIFLSSKATPLGMSRFAKESELRRAGLTKKKGFVFGKLGGTTITTRDEFHNLIVGPTRTGKSAGFVARTMFSWEDSMILFDPKGSMFEWTAAYRASIGQDVFVFAPLEKETHRFNPLDAIRAPDEGRFTDLENIARFLIPELVTSQDSTWRENAKSFLVGLLGYVLESRKYEGQRNLTEVFRLIQNEFDVGEFLNLLLQEEGLPRYVRESVGSIAKMESAKQRDGYIGQLRGVLGKFGNPRVAAAMSATDFDVSLLREKPASIFVIASPTELGDNSVVFRLFFETVRNMLTLRRPTDQRSKRRVAIIVDELKLFGPMPTLMQSLDYMGGYGVNISLCVQGVGQLAEVYDRDVQRNVMTNTRRQLYLGFEDWGMAEEVSKKIGNTTVVTTDESVNRSRMGFVQSRTKTSRQQLRPLMRPEELTKLPKDEFIMFAGGMSAIRGKKEFFLEIEELCALSEMTLSQELRPSRIQPYRFSHHPAALGPDPAETEVIEDATIVEKSDDAQVIDDYARLDQAGRIQDGERTVDTSEPVHADRRTVSELRSVQDQPSAQVGEPEARPDDTTTSLLDARSDAPTGRPKEGSDLTLQFMVTPPKATRPSTVQVVVGSIVGSASVSAAEKDSAAEASRDIMMMTDAEKFQRFKVAGRSIRSDTDDKVRALFSRDEHPTDSVADAKNENTARQRDVKLVQRQSTQDLDRRYAKARQHGLMSERKLQAFAAGRLSTILKEETADCSRDGLVKISGQMDVLHQFVDAAGRQPDPTSQDRLAS